MLLYSLSQFLIRIKITKTIIYSQENVQTNNINILYCDRAGHSEGIGVNKTSKSKEQDILSLLVLFQVKVFNFNFISTNGCHDLLMMSRNLDHIAILNIRGADYCCNINGISKVRP